MTDGLLINPYRFAVPTTLPFAPTLDGYLYGQSTSYATARETPTGADAAATESYIGQQFDGIINHTVWQSAYRLNTGATIPDLSTVTAASFSLFIAAFFGSQAWDMELYAAPIGASLDTGDFVSASEIAGLTRVARLPSSSMVAGQHNAFISDPTFPAAISKTGFTELVCISSRQRTNNAATLNNTEVATVYTVDHGTPANRPILTATWQ